MLVKYPVPDKFTLTISFYVSDKIGYFDHFTMTVAIYNSNIRINKEEVKGNGSIIEKIMERGQGLYFG
jgi:hypothetical protein